MSFHHLLQGNDRTAAQLGAVDVLAVHGERDDLVLAVQIEVTLRDSREIAEAEHDYSGQRSAAPRHWGSTVEVHDDRELVELVVMAKHEVA
jgi:hypothetical protein